MNQYRCIAGFTKPTGRRYYLGDVIHEDEYMSLYNHERRWFTLIIKAIEEDEPVRSSTPLWEPDGNYDSPRQDDGFRSPPQEDETHRFSGFDHGSFGGAGAGSNYDSPSSNDSHDSGSDNSSSSSDGGSSNDD